MRSSHDLVPLKKKNASAALAADASGSPPEDLTSLLELFDAVERGGTTRAVRVRLVDHAVHAELGERGVAVEVADGDGGEVVAASHVAGGADVHGVRVRVVVRVIHRELQVLP